MGQKYRRRLFGNKQIAFLFFSLLFFAASLGFVIYLFLFVLMPAGAFLERMGRGDSEFIFLRLLVLCFVLLFGALCSGLGFVCHQAMTIGLFRRMDAYCHDVSEGKVPEDKFVFRDKDGIKFFEKAFNDMIEAAKEKKKQ